MNDVPRSFVDLFLGSEYDSSSTETVGYLIFNLSASTFCFILLPVNALSGRKEPSVAYQRATAFSVLDIVGDDLCLPRQSAVQVRSTAYVNSLDYN